MGRILDLSRPRIGRVLLSLTFAAAVTACAARQGPGGEPPAGAAGLSADELTALGLACPDNSRACRERHLGDLALVPRHPRLARLTLDTSLRLAAVCSDAQERGPAEFRRCQDRELAGVLTPPLSAEPAGPATADLGTFETAVVPPPVQVLPEARETWPEPAPEPVEAVEPRQHRPAKTEARKRPPRPAAPAADPYDGTYMANLALCLGGDRPSECRHDRLRPEHREEVARAEYRTNLAACLTLDATGRCRPELLTPNDASRVSRLALLGQPEGRSSSEASPTVRVTDKPETLEQSASDGRQDTHVALAPVAKRKKPRQASTVPGISDDEIRQKIVQVSIAQYPGACPCLYIRDGGGRRCGGRSAYSRPGGYDPLCYPADITPEMIAQYRASAH